MVQGVKDGIVAEAGLIAYGRGEAFDYLLGEKTIHEAESAMKAAVAMLMMSENPVMSVNGNVAILVGKELVELAKKLNAKLEVNLFYRTPEREGKIEEILLKHGAGKVYGVGNKTEKIPGLDSGRGKVDSDGIFKADTVFVPLEDGDRTEALIAMKKNVITVDLNPLSRTSQKATVSIVDNIVRAVPYMNKIAGEYRELDSKILEEIVREYDNKSNLEKTIQRMKADI